MTTAVHWDRLPVELRQRKQWLLSRGTWLDKAPLSVDAAGKLYGASTTDPNDWMEFNHCINYATEHNLHVGYVLHEDDDFSCIDFDVCDAETQAAKGEPYDPSKWTSQEQFNWFWGIV